MDLAFEITVPTEVYDAVLLVAGASFANSYLQKANLYENGLAPHTVMAWGRLKANSQVMTSLKALGIRLVKPRPYGPTREAENRGEAIAPDPMAKAAKLRIAADATFCRIPVAYRMETPRTAWAEEYRALDDESAAMLAEALEIERRGWA